MWVPINFQTSTMKQPIAPPHPLSRQLVINWHVTEACNYACRYCYSKWTKGYTGRELIHDEQRTSRLIEQLRSFFAPCNVANPLAKVFPWTSIRLSLAGGEPLLYPQQIVQVARMAHKLGFDVSIITNASRLSINLMNELSGILSILGISLDSADSTRNRAIGRHNRNGHSLQIDALAKIIASGRKADPALCLKINTVVNAINHEENMLPLIRRLAPQKWKILRMLPTVTKELAVSDAQFAAFVHRHSELGLPMCVEDNVDMTRSYIMIDPHGRFFQNSADRQGYDYSLPIPDVGAARAFDQIQFSADKYLGRYAFAERTQ